MATTSLTSTKDTYIYEAAATTNYDAYNRLSIIDSSAGQAARVLLGFDISSIPAGATITAATLTLDILIGGIQANVIGETVWAYKCTQSFVEDEATWNIYSTGNNWTAAGGDYVTSSPAGESVVVPALDTTDLVFSDVIAIIQDAIDNSLSTVNLLLKFELEDQTTEDNLRLASRETVGYTDPTLALTYTVNPAVTTQAVSGINGRIAVGNGNVTDLGSPNPTQHGHCWSTSANPTTADTKTMLGAKDATGAFTSAITGLALVTGYHVRAYVVNDAGTFYGADVSFTSVGAIYPTDAITRVTNLIHRYNRALGEYTLEMALGEVTSDFGLPDWLGRPVSAAPGEKEGELSETVEEFVEKFIEKPREVSTEEETDRLRRAADEFQRRQEEEQRKRDYDLEQEKLKFERLRPKVEPTTPAPTTEEIEAEKRAFRRKATPIKPPPKPREPTEEEEIGRFGRRRG